ncbi:MAG: hypothetical protein AAGF97_01310 [Planctomycetota bacterium]
MGRVGSVVALTLFAGHLVTAGGCSKLPRTYPAAGRVVFEDGEPLRSGRVEFKSREHPYVARGSLDTEGRFRLTTFKPQDGAIAGAHQVIVVGNFVAETSDPDQHAAHAQPFDRKFSRYATTTLAIQIEPGGDNESMVLNIQ